MHPIRDQSGAVLFLHKAAFTFVSERGAPFFTVSGLGKLIERVGIAAKIGFKVQYAHGQ